MVRQARGHVLGWSAALHLNSDLAGDMFRSHADAD